MAQEIVAGDTVINSKVQDWGEGRVIDVSGSKAVVVFASEPDCPRTMLLRFLSKTSKTNLREAGPFFRKTYRSSYLASEKRSFMAGHLVDMLAREYPYLYDEDDIRLANGTQGKDDGKHFCEWYGAKTIYEKTGYYSLVEKAELPAHKGKAEILKKLVPREVVDFIYQRNKPIFGDMQCPDLLVYAPDFSEWYFCEVKGPGDHVREEQEKYFQELKDRFRKPIDLLILHERAG